MLDSWKYMSCSLSMARRGALQDEVPVGTVVVYRNQIIAEAHNLTQTNHDPTAHSEIIALRLAGLALQNCNLNECDIYVTLEPCPMCAQAISLAKIRRLYFGAEDPKGGGIIHGPRLFSQSTCNHVPECYSGIMSEECGQLLKQFFAGKR